MVTRVDDNIVTDLKVGDVLWEDDYREFRDKYSEYPSAFDVGMGGEVIRDRLAVDMPQIAGYCEMDASCCNPKG